MMKIMCNKFKIVLLVSVLLFGVSMADIANATIINLDALSNIASNPVSLSLSTGTYNVTPIGTADGGAYNGWNPWGITDGCDSFGANCTHGWRNLYSYSSSEFGTVSFGDGINYSDPLLDITNAVNSSFTLSADTSVQFFLIDSYFVDNLGGMSLSITAVPGTVERAPVPEPSTILLLGSGLFVAAALRKKIKKH